MTPPWYEKAFGPHYLDIYGHRDREDAARAVSFLLKAAGRCLGAGCTALDLCCGEGRHSLELLERLEARIVGMDLSAHLLRSITRRPPSGHLSLVRGDMRRLPFRDGVFDLTLNLFTSFGYFEEDAENEQVLKEVARTLAPEGGCFVLDHIHPAWLRENLRPDSTRVTARGTRVREQRRLDAKQRRVEKRIEFEQGGEHHALLESVRLYEPDEMPALARRYGLRLDAVYGDFDGSALGHDSPRAIYVFWKD